MPYMAKVAGMYWDSDVNLINALLKSRAEHIYTTHIDMRVKEGS